MTFKNSLRRQLLQELESCGFKLNGEEFCPHPTEKQTIRDLHRAQRQEKLAETMKSLGQRFWDFVNFFAEGSEIIPEEIEPTLIPVEPNSDTSALFRFASLLWSVPVSAGYGRRLRFLVWDKRTDRLMGLMALGDPVFNLRARDTWIGWTLKQKMANLCHVMDAYVLGAVPPYSYLLCGKLIASAVASTEISDAFRQKYGNSIGIISKKRKAPRLTLITTTSALGRSSLYNRLRLGDDELYIRVGETAGWGHFHFSKPTFERMRAYLRMAHHDYANGYRFGNGPNWRFRAVRATLKFLDMPQAFLQHGIQREVFVIPLKTKTQAILRGESVKSISLTRPLSEITHNCVRRWIAPRAFRDKRYNLVTRDMIRRWIRGRSTPAEDIPAYVAPTRKIEKFVHLTGVPA